MYKKGFVSSLFLFYFMLITIVLAVIEHQIQTQLRVFINMKAANQNLIVEMKVIDQIECNLKNNLLDDGEYEVDSIVYNVSVANDKIWVIIYNDIVIYLELDYNQNDKNILNYSSYT